MNKMQKRRLLQMQIGKPLRGTSPNKRYSYSINDFYNDLGLIIYTWSIKDYYSVISTFANNNSRSFSWLKFQLFPQNMGQIHTGRTFEPEDDGQRLIFWYANCFSAFKNKINTYLELRNKFEQQLILGNYIDANDILTILEKEVGYSLWSIEARLALCEYEGGLETNKSFLEQISSSGADAWVRNFAYFFSFKAEKGINNRQYCHRINSYTNRYDDKIKGVFFDKLFPISEYKLSDIKYILCYIFCFPLVDIYNTFIRLCTRILSDVEADKKIVDSVTGAISTINGINDIVINKLKLKANVECEISFCERDRQFIEICDLYTEGKYTILVEKARILINEIPNCFELYEIYVKAHIMGNLKFHEEERGIIKDDILIALYSSYVKDDNTPRAYFLISRLLRLFSNSNLGMGLSYFFVDKYAVGINSVLDIGKELFSPLYNIKLIGCVDLKEKLIKRFEDQVKKSSTLQLYKSLYTEDDFSELDTVDVNRRRWYEIKKGLNCSDNSVWYKLQEWYKELEADDSVYSSYQKERISTELYYLYIRDSKFIEAEQLFADETIRNTYGNLRMDLEALFSNMVIKNKELKKSICTPICASLFYKGDYTQIYSNVANFLYANKLDKPSDLFGMEHVFGRERLYYFLKKVCVREVIDSMYNVFDSEIDVDNERIEICKYLQANDSSNASEYIEEISQIMQKRRIMEGVKYLEDVKIELDFDNIYEAQKELFEDGYKRFAHINMFSKYYTAYDASNKKLYVYSNDKDRYSHAHFAFRELMEDYRQELAYGRYGLDPIIGTRIRHGHLQNNIRIAFEKNKIAFISISPDDRTYIPSEEFMNLCKNLNEVERNKLINYISDFSRNIDEYIEKINKEYLRIKIEEKNINGLFNFDISSADVAILMQTARKFQNINLVREFIEEYWKKVIEVNLKKVGSFFLNDALEFFIKELDVLSKKIDEIQGAKKIKAIFSDSISRARTDIQNSISQICGWFKLPKEQDYDNYTAQELISICEEINNRVVSNYGSIFVNKIINVSSMLKGKTFPHMVDIIIILFTNAFYHSGYINNLQALSIDLVFEENDYSIELSMTNNLSSNIDKDMLSNTVQTIQKKLKECIDKQEYYNYEGKSGYLKICKILDYNLSTQSYLEFGLNKNGKYTVKISMPKNYLIVGDIVDEAFIN